MKRPNASYAPWAGAGNLLASLLLVLVLLDAASAQMPSETSRGMAECTAIEEGLERLKCYDRLADRESREVERPKESAKKSPEGNGVRPSYFSQLWELDERGPRGEYAIKLHRSTYFLPFTYNESPNVDVLRAADPDKELKKGEVAFQLSFKAKLWQDIMGQEMDLWFGFTQRSFWQFYNFEDSSPFRETNYEPELLVNFRTDYQILGLKGRFINLGLNHQSNGQTEPLSRSWNRAVVNLGFERDKLSILLKGWYRIPDSAEDDDNAGIEDYLGYGEIWVYYFLEKHRLGLMVRNNLSLNANRGALQLEWGFPILERVGGYLQYFLGYGESLLDYNHRVNRIGIGVILVDWY